MNLKKRLSSLLLALVVAATMMGGMTGSAFADAEADAPSTDNVEVVLNGGTDHARVIGHLSKEWFRKNTESKVQVFPFASKKKAGKIAYVVGKGVPMEKFFDEIGISENELEGAELAFCQAPKYEQPNKFTLPMSQLAKATKVMKGSWDVAAGKDARTVIEGKTVTPILATAVSNSKYKTYDEAETAAADTSAEGFWSAAKNSCLIGLTGAEYTGVTQQKDGDYWIDNPATDCNGLQRKECNQRFRPHQHHYRCSGSNGAECKISLFHNHKSKDRKGCRCSGIGKVHGKSEVDHIQQQGGICKERNRYTNRNRKLHRNRNTGKTECICTDKGIRQRVQTGQGGIL